MSVSTVANADFNLVRPTRGGTDISALLSGVGQSGTTGTTGTKGAGDFRASLARFVADFQAQTFGSLFGSATDADKSGGTTSISSLLASFNESIASQQALAKRGGAGGLSASGRNTALFDPESAYQMMSVINNKDVAYKAQFAELSEMKTILATLRQAGQRLGGIGASTANDSIQSQLQNFASQYNDWVRRFDEDMRSGGILAGTEAAQVARYELDQSIENIFNGAAAGLRGLADLGLTIDDATGQATLDTAKLDSVLASNKHGAVATLREFSANFAKSAELLTADDNFVPNRLDNLSRVIDYIDEHKVALQAEFGLGDAARPSAAVARALAAYQRSFGT